MVYDGDISSLSAEKQAFSSDGNLSLHYLKSHPKRREHFVGNMGGGNVQSRHRKAASGL